MAAFNDATPRQQEILTQLSGKMGFNVNDLTNVTYAQGIPVGVTISNNTGTVNRAVLPDLGGIITDAERREMLQDREANRVVGASQTSPTNSGIPSLRGLAKMESAIDQAANEILNERSIRSIADTTTNRLIASGLSSGAVVQRPTTTPNVQRFPSAGKDLRVKISDPSRRISQLGGALAALQQTDYKVVFPFTPEISLTHSANYTPNNPTHSNYDYLFYQNSTVSEININGTFVARSPADADYVLAVQHFFRTVTKMFYGGDDIAGLPPIVCRLEGHGHLQFSYVPIVITGFSSTLPSDVDYISSTNPIAGRVPASQTISIQAKPIFSRNKLTNDFSLTKFAKGQMLGNPDTGLGGFI